MCDRDGVADSSPPPDAAEGQALELGWDTPTLEEPSGRTVMLPKLERCTMAAIFAALQDIVRLRAICGLLPILIA